MPDQNNLTFCDQLDTSVVDDLAHDLLKAAEIGTIILVLVALLLIAGNCALEWYKWRCLKRHLERTRQAWAADPTLCHTGSGKTPQVTMTDHNLLVLRGISAHPLLTRIAYSLESLLQLSPSQHTRLQWFFHYIFHPPALACFLIGFFGLLSVQIQLMAVAPLEAKFNERATASAVDLSNVIVTSVNSSMFNQSSLYANDINSRVDTIQTTINNGLFGWVNGTTSTLNDTLNEFYNDVQNVVSTVFNGTILEAPVQDFVKCFIGSKVDALEDALTFLNQNLQVDIPRVNETILVLSPSEVNEATQPIAQAALGGGQGGSDGFVARLINTYTDSLRKERIMFGVFMILWLVVFSMGLIIVFWHSYGRQWVETYKKRRWQKKKQRWGQGLVITPLSARSPVGDDKGPDMELPSFTPLPSPAPAFPLRDRFGSSSDTRSWNSFVYGDDGAIGKERKFFDPKRLMALGRKVLGRERVVPDERNVKEERDSGVPPEAKLSWISRFTSMTSMAGWKDRTSGEGTIPSGARPQIRIAIDRGSDVEQESDDDDDHDDNEGNAESPNRRSISSWSVSTLAPPPTPWTKRVAPTKNQKIAERRLPGPLDIPSDVGSTYEDAVRLQTPIKASTYITVPARHDVDNRYGRGTSSATDQSEAVTPLTKLLMTMHARKSSFAMDPFATPFDDEHRVPTGRFPPTNPFAAVAS